MIGAMRRRPKLAVLAAAALGLAAGTPRAQVSVTTYHNDNARTGQNTQETVLTTANVSSAQFGKLFTTAVDSYVYAQPLYLAAVPIAGGTHNVLFVATAHDSVYAIDADSGTVYWRTNLIPAGGRTAIGNSDIAVGCNDTLPEIGITGTPVVDPTSGTLYVVAKAIVAGGAVQYLHALSVNSGAESLGGPVAISASVPGSGYDAINGLITFSALQENQRAALLLENGHVIIAWTSHCDVDPYHGWVMSYAAASLAQEAVFNDTPNGSEGGIWMSGGGIAADANGDLFLSTGNGSWDGNTAYSESVLKLAGPSGGGFAVLDYFTPSNQAYFTVNDFDVSAGGVVLLPTLPSGRQLTTLIGKVGTMYVLDRNNLGKYCPNEPACISISENDPQIVQEIVGVNHGVWGAPAYWNGNLYWGAQDDPLQAFSLNITSGLVSTAPTSTGGQTFPYPGPTPSVSSNGSSAGIVWALDAENYGAACNALQPATTCQILYAYDATNLGNTLYTSNQAPGGRDVPGGAVKFAVPTIANGKVYVGSQYAVSAFGELTPPAAAPPTLSPAPGTYSSAQAVTLADSTPGAVIHYTTDGTAPTSNSPAYSAPIALAATSTINAIAIASGYTASTVATGTYTINLPPPVTATPLLTPAPGTFRAAQTITLTDATPNAVMYYTIDGTKPSSNSARYGAPFPIAATATVNAIATAAGHSASAIATGRYTINIPPPTPAATPLFSPPPGAFSGSQTVALSDRTPGATIHYTTDGSAPAANSPAYIAPLSLSASTTIHAIATAAGYATSAVASGVYVKVTGTPSSSSSGSSSSGSGGSSSSSSGSSSGSGSSSSGGSGGSSGGGGTHGGGGAIDWELLAALITLLVARRPRPSMMLENRV